MTARRRPRLEALEGRDTPGNLTVSFSPLTHTLTVVGDANDNDVTVTGDATSQTHFALTSTGTINGQPSPFSTPAGVKNLVFKMGDGSDTVTLDPTVPITVQGSVSINGGAGVNLVTATRLTVGQNLSVTNAAQTTDFDTVQLIDLSAGGSVRVSNAGGNSITSISRDSPGVSTIRGDVTVTNGTGTDYTGVNDTTVDGNIAVNDGHGSPSGQAGQTKVYNIWNRAFRSVVGGNLAVTYLDGDVVASDSVGDAEVFGNVTFNHGSGDFLTNLNGFNTKLPVLIHGSLTVTGSGANSAELGTFGSGPGVIVEKGFTLTSGGGTAETLSFKNVHVGGNTSIKLGNGGNTVTIDDSYFGGRFTLVSGAGADTFSVETAANTSSATEFKKAALVDLGAGIDQFDIAAEGNLAGGQVVVAWGAFVLQSPHGGVVAGAIVFPNGGEIDFNP
jgi:hypothetical protein